MAEYYRTIFTIEDRAITGLDLLELVSDSVKGWFREETGWPVTGESGTLEDDEQKLEFGTAGSGGLGRSWVVWERMTDDLSDDTWRLSVRLATEGGDLEADIEVRGAEDAHSPLFRADPPAVVHRLLSYFGCNINGRRLSTTAQRVLTEDSAKLMGISSTRTAGSRQSWFRWRATGAQQWTRTNCSPGSSGWRRYTGTITT